MAQTATRNTDVLNLPKPGTYGTTEQCCDIYQVSRTTWWRWSKMPGFPAPIRFGRSVRWPLVPIDRFLTQQEA